MGGIGRLQKSGTVLICGMSHISGLLAAKNMILLGREVKFSRIMGFHITKCLKFRTLDTLQVMLSQMPCSSKFLSSSYCRKRRLDEVCLERFQQYCCAQSWILQVTTNNFSVIGLPTGGFTDCLLRYGALFVYGVDVGYGQVKILYF
ncbi:uncharacterized protein LOC123203745 isoform X3 [Mangifera indica]|uniref:uncharacterized protein LOC123203745 isoform X3 n=2 Tax=Mangifera indica TaxID=29780 RepID=UPI001CFBB764|nr:uncharacterized protein LOC123203745 isoform X3 [Mangifera indica]